MEALFEILFEVFGEALLHDRFAYSFIFAFAMALVGLGFGQ